jgi:glycosyltransferase involved in cell wall biosynthesis
MRIGFDVAQTCIPKAGCGWAADLLAKALAENALGDQLYLYHHFGNWFNPDTSTGTSIRRPNTLEPFRGMSVRAARELWAAVALGERQLPGSPEIVHANCHQAPNVGSAKLVYTVFDLSFWIHPEYTTESNRLACQQGTLEALSRAAGLVFISESTRVEFERIFPDLCERRGLAETVAPLGSRFPDAACSRSEVPSTTWLAVGSLEPRKDYNTLLDALEQYWHRSEQRRPLVIAGGVGWNCKRTRERIEEMKHRGLVHFLGYVSEGTLNRLYREAFALIFPSRYEGFGLPIVEAMSQGCPVITRKNTSLEEVGGSAAFYFSGTSEELAHLMLEIENRPALYLERSGLALAQARKFDWNATAKKVLGLYQQIVN